MREILKNGASLFLKRQTSILSAAFVIMLTYGMSNLIGLLRTRMLIAYFFGSQTSALDVYYAAMLIPDTFFQILVLGSLSAAFIPVFGKYLISDAKQAWKIASTTLNLTLSVFIFICIGVFIFARPLSAILAPGFAPEQIILMASVLRVMLTVQIFFCVSGFMTGILQVHQRFLVPAIAPIVYNLGIIGGIVVGANKFGIWGPTWGMVFGAALHMFIQLSLATKLGFRFTKSFSLVLPGVLETLKLIPPRLLAMGIDQIEQFVAVVLASWLSAGSLSLFNVAKLLYVVPALLFGSTIGQAALPTLSLLVGQNKLEEFAKILRDACLQVIFLATPVCVLFVVLRIPIVRLTFGTKNFPWEATLLTGKTLAILAVSSGFHAVMQLMVRGFYALHDTRTPLKIGLVAAILGSTLGWALVHWLSWGIAGIAFAITITSIGETMVLVWSMKNRLRRSSLVFNLFGDLSKIFLVGLITGVCLWIPLRLLDQFVFDTTRTAPLLALTITVSGFGIGVYWGLSRLLGIEQLSIVMKLFNKISDMRKNGINLAQVEPIDGIHS